MGNKKQIILANIVLLMREYQKKHNIKRQCVTNCQYLYDTFKANYPLSDVKVKAVIGILSNEDETIIYEGHVVVEVEEVIFEPSYEVYSIRNIEYFDNIKQFKNVFAFRNKNDMKDTIKEFINFTKIADTINNGELTITDKEHYDNQADYVEEKIKPFL
jgi:hypothetical protein